MDSTDEESLNELHEEVEQFLDQEELNGVISASRTEQELYSFYKSVCCLNPVKRN